MRIYAFNMTGWEGNCITHLYNEKDYSEEEYYDICANLYIEENENIIIQMCEGGVNDDLDIFNSADSIYANVADRLEKEYGFKQITIFSEFCVDEYAKFDDSKQNTEYSKAIDTVREKFDKREREKKLNRINSKN